MDFESVFAQKLNTVTEWITELSPKGEGYHELIFDAMNYSVQNGGKRIRPILCLAVCELLGGKAENAKHFACALELIHTYSLIHDDLPCMDDDDLRRGKPTNHKVYGEAMAVLAGDALLTYAFEIAAKSKCKNSLEGIISLSSYAGANGMIGGQVIDMSIAKSKDQLLSLHNMKTGALICCAAELGAIAAAATEADKEAVTSYAKNLGLAFQIKDDILDVIGDEAVLGKPIGSDEQGDKHTFVTFYGLDGAREKLIYYTNQAKNALLSYGNSAVFLQELADYLVNRNN